MRIQLFAASVLSTLTLVVAPIAQAASVVTVRQSDAHGWTTSDTRTGGSVTFVSDSDTSFGTGALQLTNDSTNAAKAQYMHAADGSLLSDVTELSYSTKRISGPQIAAASYQLVVDLNGARSGGFATLVFEPYENGTVSPASWQTWDVDQGQFWSTKTFSDGTCQTTNGFGGAPYYTLASLKTNCPDATVISYGVNIGSYNPDFNVKTDGFVFNDVTYDFEQDLTFPTSKDECKKDGWKSFTGGDFKNQGQCVSYVASNGNSSNRNSNNPTY